MLVAVIVLALIGVRFQVLCGIFLGVLTIALIFSVDYLFIFVFVFFSLLACMIMIPDTLTGSLSFNEFSTGVHSRASAAAK